MSHEWSSQEQSKISWNLYATSAQEWNMNMYDPYATILKSKLTEDIN